MNLAALDLVIAGLQTHLQECVDEIASPRIASSITDEYKRALGYEQEHLEQHLAALGEVRVLLVEVQSKLNATLAYLRAVDIPAPPAPPSDL